MNISVAFVRTLFVLLSILFMVTFEIGTVDQISVMTIIKGFIWGLVIGAVLIGVDYWFKHFNLRSFNIAILGLFFGYLMAQALLLIFNSIVSITSIALNQDVLEIIKIFIFIFGTYIGVLMTLRASDELYVSIPFVKFAPTNQKKKDILVDTSALSDARIIDLAATGLLDRQLIIPRFLIKELYSHAESADDALKFRAKKSLEVIKKLETIPELDLRYNDTDFPEVKDNPSKLLRLARLLDANILTAEVNRSQPPLLEGIRLINIHALSNALKPLMQAGEYLKIKIQRFGKESRQGVGYLEDGTMVVVNGGGDYIGETIKARVLSVKHTSSGRMIFCNAHDDDHVDDHFEEGDYEENFR